MSIFDRLNEKTSKNDQYITQAQNIWSMLDDMAQSDPQAYKKFIDKTLKEGKELMKPPEPHMCIRTCIKEQEFYINFFSWHKIPEPENDEKPISIYGREIYSIGQVKVINIAFAEGVLKAFGKKCTRVDEQEAFVHLAFDFIDKQNKVAINRYKWNIVDELCYGSIKKCQANLMGNTESDDLINEAYNSMESGMVETSTIDKLVHINLNSNEPTKEPKKVVIEELDVVRCIPEYTLDVTEGSNLVIKVALDKILSIKECDLTIENKILELTANEKYYKKLKIDLSKYQFDQDSIEAKFIKKSFTLKITLKLK